MSTTALPELSVTVVSALSLGVSVVGSIAGAMAAGVSDSGLAIVTFGFKSSGL